MNTKTAFIEGINDTAGDPLIPHGIPGGNVNAENDTALNPKSIPKKSPSVAKNCRPAKAPKPKLRSRVRLEGMKRVQAALLAPEKKSEPIGCRLEVSVAARWEAAAKAAGVTSSALVYVAALEYLESVKQRNVLDEIRVVAGAVIESNEQARVRMERLEAMLVRLSETVAIQDSKFITVDDLNEVMGLNDDDELGPDADKSNENGG